jgi:Prokaryotic dksA/traR C4-type zinc finger
MTAEHAAARGPHWRALLEARWLARVEEVTELSLAYHVAAAVVPDGTGAGALPAPGGTTPPNPPGSARKAEITALLRRAVEARRKLADTEEALGRLAAGRFGSCEQCGAEIPPGLLAVMPETRYCPRCDAAPGQVGVLAGRTAR